MSTTDPEYQLMLPEPVPPGAVVLLDANAWTVGFRWPKASTEAAGPAADPDKPCPHEDFAVYADIGRIAGPEDSTTPNAYSASIRVLCARCGEPFRWIGVQAGLKPGRPMCSVDETELRAPLRPASSDPDFGLGIPGFAVTWNEA